MRLSRQLRLAGLLAVLWAAGTYPALAREGGSGPRPVEPPEDGKLMSGVRIRVFTSRTTTGNYLGRDKAALWLLRDGRPDTVTVDLAKLRRLQVSTGLKMSIARSTRRGTFLGFLVGTGAVAVVNDLLTHDGTPFTGHLGFGAVVGGLPGAFIGAKIGSNGSERWVDVALPLQEARTRARARRMSFAFSF